MNPIPQKYNTLIALVVLAVYLEGALRLIVKAHFNAEDAAHMNSGFLLLLTSAPIFYVMAYVPPAIWTVKNPPSSLNKWLAGLLVVELKIWGVIIYFILIALDHVGAIKKSVAEPAPSEGRSEVPRSGGLS